MASLAIFVFVWLLAHLLVYVSVWYLVDVLLIGVDHIRESEDEWLQGVGRDLVAAFCAGYIGAAVALRWFSRSTATFVFSGFAVLILSLAGTYIGIGNDDRGLVEPCCGPFLTVGGELCGGGSYPRIYCPLGILCGKEG